MIRMSKVVVLMGMALTASVANAGAFVQLPDYDPSAAAASKNPVNSVAKLTKTFASNQASDPSYIGQYLSGADIYHKVPNTFTLLASHTTSVLPFPSKTGNVISTIGSFYDAVYQDQSDKSLVFASRLELDPSSGIEINDIFRSGFSEVNYTNNDTISVAWSFATVADFRLKSAAKSSQGLYKTGTGTLPATYDVNTIDLRTDTSAPEGNPISAWYFIKVKDNDVSDTLDTYDFEWTDHAVGIYRGNDEANGSITTLWISGYAPKFVDYGSPTDPVPEPETYLMLLIGMGLISGAVLRRKTK